MYPLNVSMVFLKQPAKNACQTGKKRRKIVGFCQISIIDEKLFLLKCVLSSYLA